MPQSHFFYFSSFKTSIGIFGIVILLILLGRVAFVFPISILSNTMSGSSERTPITFKHQVVFFFFGFDSKAIYNLFCKNVNEMTPSKFFTHAKVVIWWAGLMRGAVSIALAYNQVTNNVFASYCLLVDYINIFWKKLYLI